MRLRKLSVFILDTAEFLPASKVQTDLKRQKELSYFADLLSKYAVSQMFCIPLEEVQIKKYISGAPYLPDYPGFGISKSYSGRYVVCALSTSKVGVDVERLRAPDMGVARRYFSREEIKEVFGRSNPSKENYDEAEHNIEMCRKWTELWTLKEAYGKFQEKGLSIISSSDLPTQSICDQNDLRINKILLEDEYVCTTVARDGDAQIYRLPNIKIE